MPLGTIPGLVPNLVGGIEGCAFRERCAFATEPCTRSVPVTHGADGHAWRCVLPAVVVVLDGARTLRQLPGVAQVLRDGPAVGVLAVCLDDAERLLPQECTATVVLHPDELHPDEPGRATVRRALHPPVEDVLLEHPAVRDVAVVDVPDDAYGARLVAHVVLREPVDAPALQDWVAGRLDRHAVPREVVLTDELPRGATGKVLKRELRGAR